MLSGNGNEFMLFRPHQAAGGFPIPTSYANVNDPQGGYTESITNILSLVPVDSYDFTGLKTSDALSAPTAWHYIRPNQPDVAPVHTKAWHFVYPVAYNTANGVAAGATPSDSLPRQAGTVVIPSPASTNNISLASLGLPDANSMPNPQVALL